MLYGAALRWFRSFLSGQTSRTSYTSIKDLSSHRPLPQYTSVYRVYRILIEDLFMKCIRDPVRFIERNGFSRIIFADNTHVYDRRSLSDMTGLCSSTCADDVHDVIQTTLSSSDVERRGSSSSFRPPRSGLDQKRSSQPHPAVSVVSASVHIC